ncbi:MAG: MarR family winged helix-turn-helix transcriptional regulator [Acutalibacteraceae bacterium]
MTERINCPGCEKHCDVSAPACGKGRAFAKTGVLVQTHAEHGGNGHMPRGHRADMTDANEKLIINLRDIGRMMRMQYEGKASQKRILIILRESGTLTQKELTERLGIQPGSVSEILAKLENAGLIVRVPNETDRRTTDILLTDVGAELASEAAQQRQKRHEDMFFCLTPEEKTALLSLLEKINTDWQTRFTKPSSHSCHGHHQKDGRHGGRHHKREPHRGE